MDERKQLEDVRVGPLRGLRVKLRPDQGLAHWRIRRAGAAVLVAASLLCTGLTGTSAQAAPAYRLSSLGAYLFFSDTGTFSALIPESAPLWNTIVGEGWAGRTSNATLVRVSVTGPAGSFAKGRMVQLVVRRGSGDPFSGFNWGKVVLNRTQSLSVLSAAGKTTVGFWLYGTGCTPLRLTATLRGQAATASLHRLVPFACGE
jgi:hypothetical protein